jgi:Integrase core domain
VRPSFLAARTFQRTSYLPGEISQIDWWHTGCKVPVGKDAAREAFGLVATLPHSAAHAAVFTFGRTTGDLLPAALGCFQRLGGVPEKVICDNDAAIVRERRAGTPILHDEVAAFFGLLGTRVVPLRPGDPEAKGQVERTNGYLERSFLSLRTFSGIDDLQAQHDDWAREVAFRRHHRRVGAIVADAWRVERGFLRAFPIQSPTPDGTRRHGSPGTASAASETSTTRFHRAFPGAGFRSEARRSRSRSSSRVARSRVTAAATCRPMSSSRPSTRAPCAWHERHGLAWTPRRSRFPRSIFFVLPEVTFRDGNPLLLTVEGEFVVKNLVLISAAMGRRDDDPEEERAGPRSR